jgi:ribosomal protein S12 methylthiotransferase
MKTQTVGKKISVGMLSLGCPKTLVDSELALGLLDKSRYRIAKHISDCDIAVLNTCSFIEDAKQESIDHILKLGELKAEGQIKAVVVLGCLVQRYQKELERELGEVDAFLGTGDYNELNKTLEKVVDKKRISVVGEQPGFLYTAEMERVPLTPRYTRYIKISEGCDHVCTFCTIPSFRGKHRSRGIEDIVQEATRLVDQGARELVLTGQDTTFFGRDTHRAYLLPELLRALNRIDNLKWIRLLYAYPSCVTGELIEAIGTLDKVCHYLDMPLQHVSDKMLRAMKRGTTKSSTHALIHKLKKEIADLAIRTTFIVGFPGETNRDFEELLSFMEEMRFDRLGMFMYSREEHSESAGYSDQVADAEKRERFERGMLLQQKISAENNKRMLGKQLPVLIEGVAEGQRGVYRGRTYQDAPEVDGMVYVRAAKRQRLTAGQFVQAQITKSREYDLEARLVSL